MPFIFTRMVTRTLDEKSGQTIRLEGDCIVNVDHVAAVANRDGKAVFLTSQGFGIETTEPFDHVSVFFEELNADEEAGEETRIEIPTETEQ